MNTSIEICVACFNFQRRLCWMLSSVLQQVGDVPDMVFSIAYEKNNGTPTTEDVISLFRGRGLNIKETVYGDHSRMMHRGLSRNDQLGKATCDWVLFADSDMAYDPRFFEHLSRSLRGKWKDIPRCMTAKRFALKVEPCEQEINDLVKHPYPCVVEGAGLLSGWPCKGMSLACGAGFFQLVNRKTIMDKTGGMYVDPALSGMDGLWKFRSDQHFRGKIGGISRIRCLPQYHLAHAFRPFKRIARPEVQL